jgi:hypothetical protein
MEIPTELTFDHLHNTNSTPSQEQRQILQNSILQLDEAILNTEGDISGINEQILALQDKIQVLQTHHTQLVQQRRCYSTLLSSVRCLPIEIFSQIFVYATHDFPKHVLNLSAVCQLWRYAALSTPILWSTLELGHHVTKCNMDNHIDSWVERARSYPLSLVIRHHDGMLDPVNNALTLLTSHKWKSIALDGNNTSISSILKELEFTNLEMLESFSVGSQYSIYSRFEVSLPNTLRYLPKLKTLSLYGNCFVAFDTLPIPWSQLTSLTIAFLYNDIDVDILRACVNLEEFIKDGESSLLASNDSITFNYLRKMHAYSTSASFLSSLKTPSIQDFAIKTYVHVTAVIDYIAENGSTLLKLSISQCDSKLVASIPYLRCLVELQLRDNDYDHNGSTMMYEILSSFVVKPEMDPSTIPLPRLESLEVICSATETNETMFMQVIDSRWWSDEEEDVRQKQGQRSLSRIKQSESVLLDVRTEFKMFGWDHMDTRYEY